MTTIAGQRNKVGINDGVGDQARVGVKREEREKEEGRGREEDSNGGKGAREEGKRNITGQRAKIKLHVNLCHY